MNRLLQLSFRYSEGFPLDNCLKIKENGAPGRNRTGPRSALARGFSVTDTWAISPRSLDQPKLAAILRHYIFKTQRGQRISPPETDSNQNRSRALLSDSVFSKASKMAVSMVMARCGELENLGKVVENFQIADARKLLMGGKKRPKAVSKCNNV